MRLPSDDTVETARRVGDVFQAPSFDDARFERVLAAARIAEGAERRVRVSPRRAGFAVALMACAAVLVAVAAWPRAGGGPAAGGPPGPALYSEQAIRLSGLSAKRGSAAYGSASVKKMIWRSRTWASALGPVYKLDHGLASPADSGVNTLELSTEVLSGPVVAGDTLAVRLRLTNFWGPTVHWDDFGFGLTVTTTYQPDPNMPDGIGIGGMEIKPSIPGDEDPLTLGWGESTTTIMSTAVPAGRWEVVGSYVGGPWGRTPPIEIVVRKRAP